MTPDDVDGVELGVVLREGGWMEGEKCMDGEDCDAGKGGNDGTLLCVRSARLIENGAEGAGIGSIFDCR
jgi:hypothetical protein